MAPKRPGTLTLAVDMDVQYGIDNCHVVGMKATNLFDKLYHKSATVDIFCSNKCWRLSAAV